MTLAVLAGVAVGTFYFGGLWLTTQWMGRARRPALLALASFAARLAPTLAIFYIAMDGRPERLIACLVGFIAARTLFVVCLRPQPISQQRRT